LIYYLVPESNTPEIQLFPNEKYLIGRSPQSNILLTDKAISREHAKLEYSNSTFILEDLGSTNGTKVNDSEISIITLESMDKLTFGRISFTFKIKKLSKNVRTTLTSDDTRVLEEDLEMIIDGLNKSTLKNQLTAFQNKMNKKRKDLITLAYGDELTGLYNRRYFDKELETEIKRAVRYNRPLTMIMVDIDKFKVFNDTYGHQNESGIVSKAYSRLLLLNCEEEPNFDHIFIDESQDLYPVELQLLKKLSRICLVMAGDTDQSIYGIGSPYKRAGVSTSGTTRLLRTNFRNTLPIHRLAEDFRRKGEASYDKLISPRAFRDGPVPELYSSTETDELYDLLIEKVKIFVNTIEYDPENICILAPSVKFLGKIGDKLTEAGFSSVNIKDTDFSFKSEGSIRLSPMHSSKGLDLPVVLLFIPILFYNRELEQEESEKLVRNLVYVSMTRAMENLNVFVKKGSEDPVITDLINLMDNDIRP